MILSEKSATFRDHALRRVVMVVLSKIYTRTGDDGTTALGSGRRVSKYDLRVEAYGTLDETNAAIGIARLHTREGHPVLDAMLARIQNDLFDLGADLCFPDQTKDARGRLRSDRRPGRAAGKRDRHAQPRASTFALLRAAGRLACRELPASRPHHLAPRRAPHGGARRQEGRERSAPALFAISIGCRISCSSRPVTPTTRASPT